MNREGAEDAPPRTVPGARSTLLYARPGIIVTVDRFTVGRNSYRVADLTHLRTTRGPHDRIAVRAVVITASMLGGVGVLLGFTGGLHRLTAGAYLILGAVFLLPAAARPGRRPLAPTAVRAVGVVPGYGGAALQRRRRTAVRPGHPGAAAGPGGQPLRRLGRPARRADPWRPTR